MTMTSSDWQDKNNHHLRHRPDMTQSDMAAYRPRHIRTQPMSAAVLASERNPYSRKERADMGPWSRPNFPNNMPVQIMRPRPNIPAPNPYHRHEPYNGYPPARMATPHYTQGEHNHNIGYYKPYQNDAAPTELAYAGIPPSAAAAATEAAATAYEDTLQAEFSRAARTNYGQYPNQTSASSHVENKDDLPKTRHSAPFQPFHNRMAGMNSQRRIITNFNHAVASMPTTSGPYLAPGFSAAPSQDRLESCKNLATKDDHDAWGVMFEALLLFKAKHGHCRVPLSYSPNPQLAKWVKHQKSSTNSLKSQQRDKLVSLGFFEGVSAEVGKNKHKSSSTASSDNNNPRSSFFWEKHWNEMLERLTKYKEKKGHSIVPFPFEEDPQLGYWVKKQRLKKKSLSRERLQKLDKLGFEWDQEVKTQDEVWEEMFERLKAFEKINAHCFVPSRYKEDPKLGSWVHRQRHSRETQKLRPDRLLKLESIGFM